MLREDAENQSDRDILVSLLVGQAVLEERTQGWEEKLDNMGAKAERNERDISWIKRIGVSLFTIMVAIGGGAFAWFLR